jgi:hypothetical protein
MTRGQEEEDENYKVDLGSRFNATPHCHRATGHSAGVVVAGGGRDRSILKSWKSAAMCKPIQKTLSESVIVQTAVPF